MQGCPWIRFQNPVRLTERMVELGGRCSAMLEELVSHPVKPALAAHLESVFLSKGLQGTTAIEGNTLTQQEVEAIVRRETKPRPPSTHHLQLEIENLVRAYDGVLELAETAPDRLLMPDRVRWVHEQITRGLDHVEAVPGRFRTVKVVVGAGVYHPPSEPRPIDRLMERLVQRLREWLLSERFADSPLLDGMIRAIVAHVYIAWIHPFSDGNGRTARTLELGLLRAARVPKIGAVLLANHYNKTRNVYMKELKDASRVHDGNLTRFVEYALQGLHDNLAEALDTIRAGSLSSSWENYIYERFRDEYGANLSIARARARGLVLWLSLQPPKTRAQVSVESPSAQLYAMHTSKMVSRDLRLLSDLDLVEQTAGGYRAKIDTMLHFRIEHEELVEVQPSARTRTEAGGQLELFAEG